MKKLNLNENFISRIWRDKIHYSDLKTTDGKPVEVLDYGTLNTDSGADYKNAKVKINNVVFCGDIEIHRSLNDWEQHDHKKSGKYNKVILQVVFWNEDFPCEIKVPKVMKSREIPTVILSKFLNKSIHEIWKEIINNPSSGFKIPCFPENEYTDVNIKKEFIRDLSLKRIEYRASRLRQRLDVLENVSETEGKKQIWEKVFFEYTLEALGFSKNKEQFLKFAESVDLNKIKKLNLTFQEIESLFLNTGGLLENVRYKDEYIEKLKATWKNIAGKFKSKIFNKSEWNFFRLRPQNFPTVRMAYASAFCTELIFKDFFKRVVMCFEKSKNTGKDLSALFLDIRLSEYWESHYVFGKEVKTKIKSIGEDRVKDIIVNVVLPLLYLYSEIFGRNDLKEKISSYYFGTTDRGENEITKVMQKQLFLKVNTISDKQGLIHLHNFFCVKVKCNDCPVGKNVYGKKEVSGIIKIILY